MWERTQYSLCTYVFEWPVLYVYIHYLHKIISNYKQVFQSEGSGNYSCRQ